MSVQLGKSFLGETLDQPRAWAETIPLVLDQAPRLKELFAGVGEVIFTGCGSGLNASYAIAPVFQALTGIRARAVPAAELVHFPETILSPRDKLLVVPISRSGSTTETVMARDAVKQRGIDTLSITCYADCSLATASTAALVLESVREQAITTSQSLTAMVLCGQLVSGIVARHQTYLDQLKGLPEWAARLMDTAHALGQRLGKNRSITKCAFVGSGPYYGLARESQLKFKEMTLLPSDSYPVFDYRHGPKSNVDEHMLVTVFVSDRARPAETEFIKEMKGLRGQVLALCDRSADDITDYADYVMEIDSGLPDLGRGILYLPVLHLMAYYKALDLGLDPDNPRNLPYYVGLDRL